MWWLLKDENKGKRTSVRIYKNEWTQKHVTYRLTVPKEAKNFEEGDKAYITVKPAVPLN